ncbi:MAG: TfoX/Sxy family protein [Bacteroidota bacterium]
MSKKPEYPPEEKIALYDALVALFPDVDRKGKTSPYTSLNGHMFSFLDKTGVLGIRLSPEDKAAFEAEHNTSPFIQYGKVMNGYVTVPDELLSNPESLRSIFEKSVAYIASLKPKPTKRKKK